MAMNFNRPAGAPTTAVAAKPETALMEVQPYGHHCGIAGDAEAACPFA